MGYTYQADVAITATNRYGTNIQYYNLLLMGSSAFVAPTDISQYVPRIEFFKYNRTMLKSTGHYQAGVSTATAATDYQIVLNANTTTNLGSMRIYYNDPNFTLTGTNEETVNPNIINQASLAPIPGSTLYYYYSRDMIKLM